MKVFYEQVTNLEKNIETLFEKLKWKEIVAEDERVIIKPNFCKNYEDGATTNMDLLAAIVKLVKKRTSDVFVGETESHFKSQAKLIDGFSAGCDFLNLSKEETFVYKGLNLPKIALNSTIINVPVFKTHVLTGMTLGIKNLFGFIQDKGKSQYHYKIDSTLMKILDVIKPQINILDGIYSMDTNGPTDGRIKRTDFLMASNDVVALDVAACRVAGISPSQITHIWQAKQKYGISPEGAPDILIDFNVPKVGMLTKCGAYLQYHPLSRRLLKNPNVHALAKRVKDIIDAPKI